MAASLNHDVKHLLRDISLPLVLWLSSVLAAVTQADTVALWLFDEQIGLYPSCVLGDASSGNYPLVIGPGGQIVEGKFGNSLETSEQPKVDYPADFILGRFWNNRRGKNPLTWTNAKFCALMTRGENHVRKEVGFASPTRSRLNLGNFDWTVEFWYLPTLSTEDEGIVLEVGQGLRGDNDRLTQLMIESDRKGFALNNQPSGTRLSIPSNSGALDVNSADWHHFAFVYDSANNQLRHYVDGKLQPLPEKCSLKAIEQGMEDYLSIGRDGLWNRALPGRLDELRVSDEQVYTGEFAPPGTFSKLYSPEYKAPKLQAGLPLLFADDRSSEAVVPLAHRKYMFIDDAIVAEMKNVTFRVNPPRMAERVFDSGRLSNHITVFQGDDGLVRIYGRGPKNSLAVWIAKDGVHFEAPDLGNEYLGARNVVIEDPVGLGTVFVDPNAPSDERIKYFSGYRGRGSFVYSSPDGYHFKRNETSSLPFRAASQSNIFYDAQRQLYVGYHRSDMLRTPGQRSKRTFVLTEITDVLRPWPFRPVSPAEHLARAKQEALGLKLPYFLDNGPLTPPGFGIEFPHVIAPEESLDPVATDIYVPKCVKYPWAPDTYLAFPIMYFHYKGDGPKTRQILGQEDRDRGSGPLETQMSVSRDGVHWKRYPRPAYISIGDHAGYDLHKTYIGHGMAKQGTEIWQYFVGSEQYHSSWSSRGREAVFRVVQRLDGFVSADTPYDGGLLKTRPLVFQGNRLVLNIDTGATGYTQVGILDEHGMPIEGYDVDDCIYINGDFSDTQVEWLDKGKGVSELAGQPVQLVFRMYGTKLYSMQFLE